MRTIRVFVSVSNGLGEVETAVRDLLVHLNKHFKPRGVEFLPTPPGAGPSTGDFVLALYWRDFGSLPKEDFEKAYESFKTSKSPKIYVFFRDPDPDITEAIKAFKDSFSEKYGHFYCHFENVDSVKFQLAVQSLSLLPDSDTRDAWRVDGEKVLLGDVTVASLENLPFAKLNSRRRTLQRQAAREEEEIRELNDAANAAPDDEDLKDALREAQIRRNSLRNELRQHDEFLFNLALRFARESTKEMDERVRKARELFERGKAREANRLLDLPEMEAQATRNLSLFQANRDACEKDIQAFATKAELVLVDDGITMTERVAEACQSYENAIRIAREIRLEDDALARILFDYACLLQKQNRLYDSVKLYEEALGIHRRLSSENPEAYEPRMANTLNNLASSHLDLQRLEDAEREFVEALEIYRRLAAGSPEAYEPGVATMLNNLASLHRKTQRLEVAERECAEALDISRRLSLDNPNVYEQYVATALNNMAEIHFLNQRLEDAERECVEALEIDRRLASANPTVYEPKAAGTYIILAVLHYSMQRLESAERENKEALKIYHRLASENPEAYEPDMTTALTNLAVLHVATHQLQEAERDNIEALKLCRRLASGNPSAFEPNLAMTLNNLGLLHSDMLRLEEADRELGEALEIRRRLVSANPKAYEPDLAMTLNNLAKLHVAAERFEAAEREFLETLAIYQRLSLENSAAYEPYVARSLNNLAGLYYATNRSEEAERKLVEALELYRHLASVSVAYVPDMATAVSNLAALHGASQRLEEAEREYTEALEIYNQLALWSPEAFEPLLANTLCNWALLKQMAGDEENSRHLANMGLEVYRRCEERCPGEYEDKLAWSLSIAGREE